MEDSPLINLIEMKQLKNFIRVIPSMWKWASKGGNAVIWDDYHPTPEEKDYIYNEIKLLRDGKIHIVDGVAWYDNTDEVVKDIFKDVDKCGTNVIGFCHNGGGVPSKNGEYVVNKKNLKDGGMTILRSDKNGNRYYLKFDADTVKMMEEKAREKGFDGKPVSFEFDKLPKIGRSGEHDENKNCSEK